MLETIRIAAAVIVAIVLGFLFGAKGGKATTKTIPTNKSPVVQTASAPTTKPVVATPIITKLTTPAKPAAKPVANKLQDRAVAPVAPTTVPVQPVIQPTTQPAPVVSPTPVTQPFIQTSTSPTPSTQTRFTVGANGVPRVGDCQIFPADHPYNTNISSYPVHPQSADYIAKVNAMGTRTNVHPDFGGQGLYGMPINIVGNETSMVPITFTAYGSESDLGPYRIPSYAIIQPGTDRHLVVVDKVNCKLYEMFHAFKNQDNSWRGDSGVIWDLNQVQRRPLGYTSADGAGMAIYPLVVKYDEVALGQVNHAIRMTVPKTRRGFIWPANHYASDNDDPSLPPFGLRFRLKADFDISKFKPQAKAVATAMKKYGMIVAQNGSAWAIGGEQDPRFDDSQLRDLKKIPSSALEVIYTGEIITRK